MLKCQELNEKEGVCIKTQRGQEILCSHSVVKYALELIAETGACRKQKLTEVDVRPSTI